MSCECGSIQVIDGHDSQEFFSMVSFPLWGHLPDHNLFIDQPAFQHLIDRHMLRDQPILRQFRRQFEKILGTDNVTQAIEEVLRKEGSMLPAARKLLELIIDDDRAHWVSYRRETDAGVFLDRRMNLFLRCGLIVVVQVDQHDWFLRTAFFAAERNKVHENRREAIRNVIRNQIGKRVNGRLEFDPKHRYRGKLKSFYSIHTDFELSDPSLFGVKCSAQPPHLRYFDLNSVKG